jgi:hypothetical protein
LYLNESLVGELVDVEEIEGVPGAVVSRELPVAVALVGHVVVEVGGTLTEPPTLDQVIAEGGPEVELVIRHQHILLEVEGHKIRVGVEEVHQLGPD